jgi:hypothetical protein
MKKILSDCDGVLLDWNYAFEKWMKFHFGIVAKDSTAYDINTRFDLDQFDQPMLDKNSKFYLPRIFCNSSRQGSLKPMGDAVLYVRKLYDEFGITIDVVTSLSLDPETQKLREQNLRSVFGNAIDRVVCLDTGADKDEALEEWRDSGLIWVEDKQENADVGLELGLDSIIIDQPYNRDYNGKARRAQNWKDIYEYVLGETLLS